LSAADIARAADMMRVLNSATLIHQATRRNVRQKEYGRIVPWRIGKNEPLIPMPETRYGPGKNVVDPPEKSILSGGSKSFRNGSNLPGGWIMTGILPSLRDLILNRTFEEKYVQAVGIINTNLQEFHPKKIALAYSGGKDSTATLFMVRNECMALDIDPNDVTILFENTGVEYPETIQFIKEIRDLWGITNFIETKPEKTFWQCVKEYGYPRSKSNRTQEKGKKGKRPLCCEYLKERPGKKVLKNFDAVFLGITAMESHQRQMRAVTHGTCYYAIADKIKKIHPLLYFTEPEIWELHTRMGIPHNKVYDLGVDRCGCMPCTAYKKWKENLQMTNPKMYRKIMKDMGQVLIE